MAKWTEERRRKEVGRKADRINRKVTETIPLFADQVELVSAEAIYWQNRRHAHSGGEHGIGGFEGNYLLRVFQVRFIRDFAREHMTAEQFELLDMKCFETCPAAEYWYDFWKRVLIGEAMPMKYERVENRQPGQPATVVVESWPPTGWKAPFATREEFYAAFPYEDKNPAQDHPGAVQPDYKQ